MTCLPRRGRRREEAKRVCCLPTTATYPTRPSLSSSTHAPHIPHPLTASTVASHVGHRSVLPVPPGGIFPHLVPSGSVLFQHTLPPWHCIVPFYQFGVCLFAHYTHTHYHIWVIWTHTVLLLLWIAGSVTGPGPVYSPCPSSPTTPPACPRCTGPHCHSHAPRPLRIDITPPHLHTCG